MHEHMLFGSFMQVHRSHVLVHLLRYDKFPMTDVFNRIKVDTRVHVNWGKKIHQAFGYQRALKYLKEIEN